MQHLRYELLLQGTGLQWPGPINGASIQRAGASDHASQYLEIHFFLCQSCHLNRSLQPLSLYFALFFYSPLFAYTYVSHTDLLQDKQNL